ncbi:thiamine pyrophosphate-binding protein [Ottowia sp.]|uniref:thiamine pyrophosphate-binding protein n=1 Tax=Ottowia sp. TaxID=1898956 RepID=UPI0025E306CE|nr:thiamine pyrophosphate-binding protein [Ottowia sp.]MBK6613704.1 thiamine pyrophosphate-binding protein [Ottowia sp.]
MADAYARVTRSLGVAVVTGCPGHTNALTGMSVAMNAQSPVLVISGLTPVDQRDRGGSQVLHQADLARPVTKWALEVPSAVHMAEMVTKAIQIATSGTPGPVSLSVPSDVFEDTVQKAKDDPLDHLRQVTARAPLAVRTSLSADGLAQVRQLLQGASRPVLILGNGARRDGSAEQANAIVQKLGIPVFTIDQARGLVPDDGRHCFGYADPLFSAPSGKRSRRTWSCWRGRHRLPYLLRPWTVAASRREDPADHRGRRTAESVPPERTVDSGACHAGAP